MRERPILFAGDMVREILAGGKTQTRRVVMPQPDFAAQPRWTFGPGHSGEGWYCSETEYPDEGSVYYECPYGIPGDRLWVRETWATHNILDGKPPREASEDAPVWYKAGGQVKNSRPYIRTTRGSWRPSIHMPRWMSRITLEVTSVHVERIRDIGREPADALAEGIQLRGDSTAAPFNAVSDFAALWDRINERRGFGWKVNPWVWVVKFRRC